MEQLELLIRLVTGGSAVVDQDMKGRGFFVWKSREVIHQEGVLV